MPKSIVGDANPFYGRVVYGPGLALDQPLSVTRFEYRDNPYSQASQTWPTFTLVPFWDYRGTPAFGLFSDGAFAKPYVAGGSSCPASPGTGTTDRCVYLTWPFAGSAYHQDRGLVQTFSWQGSLLLKKRDVSGLTYARNRMYDPGTGRFTQEDPIGLAGGLNAYGFASGDPVNYADPFGLCPDSLKTKTGTCPGALSVAEWDRIVYAANNRLTEDARKFVLGLLYRGEISSAASFKTKAYAIAQTSADGRVTILNRALGREYTAGELAFLLAHESEHVRQGRWRRAFYEESRLDMEADAYGCANTHDRGAYFGGAYRLQYGPCGSGKR